MRKLITKVAYLLLTTFIVIFFIAYIDNHIMLNNKYYKLDNRVNILVVGYSYTENALNDKIMTNTVNLSDSADPYFYTYFKIKKLLEANPGIKIVLLSCSDGIFGDGQDVWIYRDDYLISKYRKYSHIMEFKYKIFLFYKNPITFIDVLWDTFQQNLFKILKDMKYNDLVVYRDLTWGGYLHLEEENVTKKYFELKATAERKNRLLKFIPKERNTNIEFLHKIADLCDHNNVQLILLRTPISKYAQRPFEHEFKSLLSNDLGKVIFWDYVDFKLRDDDFADFVHLNYKGAKIFTEVINDRLIKMSAEKR